MYYRRMQRLRLIGLIVLRFDDRLNELRLVLDINICMYMMYLDWGVVSMLSHSSL